MKTVQNFYKSSIIQDWTIGTGTFYVSIKPTVTEGWLVVSPNNATLREVIYYNAVGTDGNGDYINVTVRGVGATDEQTHFIGEPVRMNIDENYWADINTDISNIVAAGAPNASTTTKGLIEIATDAEVIAGTDTGSTGASLVATPSQLKTNYGKLVPIIKKYEWIPNATANSLTRFDITNPSGTTFRYTYDGNGVDPVINSTTFPIGSIVAIYSENFTTGNNGIFTITGSGTNYFEVTNASGFAENDKTLGTYLNLLTYNPLYTKPDKLKYIEIEMVGGGGASQTKSTSGQNNGGDGGAYVYKLFDATNISSTETFTIGLGGRYKGSITPFSNGTATTFKTLSAGGGNSGNNTSISAAASGGDININGVYGSIASLNYTQGAGSMLGVAPTNNTTTAEGQGYGWGARSTLYSSYLGSNGGNGVLIIKEYF